MSFARSGAASSRGSSIAPEPVADPDGDAPRPVAPAGRSLGPAPPADGWPPSATDATAPTSSTTTIAADRMPRGIDGPLRRTGLTGTAASPAPTAMPAEPIVVAPHDLVAGLANGTCGRVGSPGAFGAPVIAGARPRDTS